MDCTPRVSSESHRGRFSSLQSHSWRLVFNLSLNNTSHTTCEFSPDLWTQDVPGIALAPQSQGIGPVHSPAPMSPDLVHTTLPHRPRSSSAQPSKAFSSTPTLTTVCCHFKRTNTESKSHDEGSFVLKAMVSVPQPTSCSVQRQAVWLSRLG